MNNKELIRRLISFDEGDTSTGFNSISGKNKPSSKQVEWCLIRYAEVNGYDYEKDLIRSCGIKYDERTGNLTWGEDDFISTEVDSFVDLVLDKCEGIRMLVPDGHINLKGTSEKISKLIPILVLDDERDWVWKNSLTIELWDKNPNVVLDIRNHNTQIECIHVYTNNHISSVTTNVDVVGPVRKYKVSCTPEITVVGLIQKDYGKEPGVSFQSGNGFDNPRDTKVTFKDCDIQTIVVEDYDDPSSLGTNITGLYGLSCVDTIDFYECPYEDNNRQHKLIANVKVKPDDVDFIKKMVSYCNVDYRNPAEIDVHL